MTPEQILSLPNPNEGDFSYTFERGLRDGYMQALEDVTELLRKEGAEESLAVDEAWLRSVGFMRNDVDPFIWINDGYNDWECDLEWWPDEQRFWLESDGMMIQLPDKIKTRGDVRLLCKSLGVKLEDERT